jgi:hypothetical protein
MPQNTVRAIRHLQRQTALVAALMMLMTACRAGNEAPKTPLSELSAQAAAGTTSGSQGGGGAANPLPRDALIALDSGNALYRLKKYSDALVQYRLATKRAPDDASGYFGIYMVADATKNRPLLDSAVVALQARGMTVPAGVHK